MKITDFAEQVTTLVCQLHELVGPVHVAVAVYALAYTSTYYARAADDGSQPKQLNDLWAKASAAGTADVDAIRGPTSGVTVH